MRQNLGDGPGRPGGLRWDQHYFPRQELQGIGVEEWRYIHPALENVLRMVKNPEQLLRKHMESARFSQKRTRIAFLGWGGELRQSRVLIL